MVDRKKDKSIEALNDLDELIPEERGEEEASPPEGEVMDDRAAAEDIEEAGEVFPEAEEEKAEDMLDIAADVPVQVVAVMGKKNITLKELASLRMGEVIELGRPASEMVDLVAGGKLIARGELVEIEGKLGVRIVKLVR